MVTAIGSLAVGLGMLGTSMVAGHLQESTRRAFVSATSGQVVATAGASLLQGRAFDDHATVEELDLPHG